jgi:hypothetical protein
MARESKIEELEARKRALVNESERYRELLKSERQNLQLHGATFADAYSRWRRLGPWLLLAGPVALPLLGRLFGKKQEKPPATPPSRLKLAISAGISAARLYQRYRPWLRTVWGQLRSRRGPGAESRGVSSAR